MSTTTAVISPPPTAASSSYHRPVRLLSSSSSSRGPKINQFSRSFRINFHPINKRLHHLEEQHSLLAGELRSWRCSAVATIGESEFSGEVLESEVPVLVEFVANWCGPCRLISSIIEWASQEYEDKLKIVKIDHDANPRLIEEYKVYGLPCLILFKNGQEVPESRREGAITKAKLKEYLDSLLVVHM